MENAVATSLVIITLQSLTGFIKYYYLPITPGSYASDLKKQFSELLNTTKSPVLAFCRTGNRRINLLVLSQASIHREKYISAKLKNWLQYLVF